MISIQTLIQKMISPWIPDRGVIISPYRKVDVTSMFQQKAPLVIEIGVGKGLFIRQYAQQNPEMNFFGIEKYPKWTRHAAKRIENAKLKNVRLIRSTAEEIFPHLSDSSVSEYHILFPDPWPKRRHQNRRVIQTNTIQKMHQTLVDQGLLHIATDHLDYYKWMREVIQPWIGTKFTEVQAPEGMIQSNYQIKYLKEGRSIYEIYLRKT